MNKLKTSILIAFVAAAAIIIPIACDNASGDDDYADPTPVNGGEDGNAEPTVLDIPSYWFESDFDSWIGKRYDEIDLFQLLAQHNKPTNLAEGKRYVVFYSRNCEHCEEMFKADLAPNMSLAATVTAVEIPNSKTLMRDENAWPMPENACELLELPLDCNWVITPPLGVRLEDGVIKCAGEGDVWRECLELD